jgi:GMP synthase-like glutamine amidotransferase
MAETAQTEQWHMENRLDDRGRPCGINICVDNGNIVARMPDGAIVTGGHAFKTIHDRAKLATAAPALLAACEKLANIAEVVGHCTGTWTPEHQRLAQQYAAEARAAIARTKGA